MGARLVVEFNSQEPTNPRVYLHWGGEMLDEVNATLQEFQYWQATAKDTRWSDPIYMSARFCAWAYHNANGTSPDGLGVGIVSHDGWGDAHAVFACDGTNEYTIKRAIDMEGTYA